MKINNQFNTHLPNIIGILAKHIEQNIWFVEMQINKLLSVLKEEVVDLLA